MTVAKAIDFKDRFQNMGAQLVRQVRLVVTDVSPPAPVQLPCAARDAWLTCALACLCVCVCIPGGVQDERYCW